MRDSNTIMKFADDMMAVALIPDNDEGLIPLNVSKTKELIVDYRKRKAEHAPIHMTKAVEERVENFKFLGVHITKDLSWSKHTNTVVERTQKRLFPIRRGFGILKKCYSCTIESILTGCITAWYSNCSAFDASRYSG